MTTAPEIGQPGAPADACGWLPDITATQPCPNPPAQHMEVDSPPWVHNPDGTPIRNTVILCDEHLLIAYMAAPVLAHHPWGPYCATVKCFGRTCIHCATGNHPTGTLHPWWGRADVLAAWDTATPTPTGLCACPTCTHPRPGPPTHPPTPGSTT